MFINQQIIINIRVRNVSFMFSLSCLTRFSDDLTTNLYYIV
ncbi:Uncharacterized protein dnm_034670 [Desulfonema magnum]|uniref:Uncharacterized protein n=1 Tax=Desulfonema magnum TaxID=45655 RepID=A0A975BLY6_9BACT|nr:Uncharacterized protein dnm_034630 [Desulfonema magnum]QTA87433.1 Uncharacterized protein dnm_034670 [Desulfonema magnum]